MTTSGIEPATFRLVISLIVLHICPDCFLPHPLQFIMGRSKRFFFLQSNQITLGSTQTSIKWIPVARSSRVKSCGVKQTTSAHLVPRLRKSGVVLPLGHVPLWPTHGQLYIYLAHGPFVEGLLLFIRTGWKSKQPLKLWKKLYYLLGNF